MKAKCIWKGSISAARGAEVMASPTPFRLLTASNNLLKWQNEWPSVGGGPPGSRPSVNTDSLFHCKVHKGLHALTYATTSWSRGCNSLSFSLHCNTTVISLWCLEGKNYNLENGAVCVQQINIAHWSSLCHRCVRVTVQYFLQNLV